MLILQNGVSYSPILRVSGVVTRKGDLAWIF